MNSNGRLVVVGAGACGAWCVTWSEGVGSIWGSLVCACFLAILIWMGLPDANGAALGVPYCINCL